MANYQRVIDQSSTLPYPAVASAWQEPKELLDVACFETQQLPQHRELRLTQRRALVDVGALQEILLAARRHLSSPCPTKTWGI